MGTTVTKVVVEAPSGKPIPSQKIKDWVKNGMLSVQKIDDAEFINLNTLIYLLDSEPELEEIRKRIADRKRELELAESIYNEEIELTFKALKGLENPTLKLDPSKWETTEISQLPISERLRNVLKNNEVRNVAELLKLFDQLNDPRKLRNIGDLTRKELISLVAALRMQKLNK